MKTSEKKSLIALPDRLPNMLYNLPRLKIVRVTKFLRKNNEVSGDIDKLVKIGPWDCNNIKFSFRPCAAGAGCVRHPGFGAIWTYPGGILYLMLYLETSHLFVVCAIRRVRYGAMSRKSRIDVPGALYHIIVRGIDRRRVFADNTDRNNLLDRVVGVNSETNTCCFAWARIPSHFPLLLRTGQVAISTVMLRLLTGCACYFNEPSQRALFQNSFKFIKLGKNCTRHVT